MSQGNHSGRASSSNNNNNQPTTPSLFLPLPGKQPQTRANNHNNINNNNNIDSLTTDSSRPSNTLQSPVQWKEGLSDMPIIVINMIEEDNHTVRLTPESRIALHIDGSGDSSDYLLLVTSHKPKVPPTLQDNEDNITNKVLPFIECKYRDMCLTGKKTDRGSSEFIEMNIDTLYDKFFPPDHVGRYESQKLIELIICDGKQTRHLSFKICKTKPKGAKRINIVYGNEEGGIMNRKLRNEENLRAHIARQPSEEDNESSSTISEQSTPRPVLEEGMQQPPPPPQQSSHNTPQGHQPPPPPPQQDSIPPTQPRIITRETMDQYGKVTRVTEFYDAKDYKDSPMIRKRNQSRMTTRTTTNATTYDEEVIVIDLDNDDDVVEVVTPTSKKHKPNGMSTSNNSDNCSSSSVKEELKKAKQEQGEESSNVGSSSSTSTRRGGASFSNVIISIDD